jgi:hypothetical protein
MGSGSRETVAAGPLLQEGEIRAAPESVKRATPGDDKQGIDWGRGRVNG